MNNSLIFQPANEDIKAQNVQYVKHVPNNGNSFKNTNDFIEFRISPSYGVFIDPAEITLNITSKFKVKQTVNPAGGNPVEDGYYLYGSA